MPLILVQIKRTIPLVLSSALATALIVTRIWASGSPSYIFLVWNLILAWVPYSFSLLTEQLDQRRVHPLLLLAPAACWLAFLPNAPYLVTDFIHLREQPPVPLWYDAILLMSFAWSGCFVGIASLHAMHSIVVRHAGWLLGWLFVGASTLLSGYGIYLGRFQRWNSWDVLLEPRALASDILPHLIDPLSHPQTLTVTLLFAAFMMVAYLSALSVGQLIQQPAEEP